jgi:hypothetical protein
MTTEFGTLARTCSPEEEMANRLGLVLAEIKDRVVLAERRRPLCCSPFKPGTHRAKRSAPSVRPRSSCDRKPRASRDET